MNGAHAKISIVPTQRDLIADYCMKSFSFSDCSLTELCVVDCYMLCVTDGVAFSGVETSGAETVTMRDQSHSTKRTSHSLYESNNRFVWHVWLVSSFCRTVMVGC